jgi:hypothetical protein
MGFSFVDMQVGLRNETQQSYPILEHYQIEFRKLTPTDELQEVECRHFQVFVKSAVIINLTLKT